MLWPILRRRNQRHVWHESRYVRIIPSSATRKVSYPCRRVKRIGLTCPRAARPEWRAITCTHRFAGKCRRGKADDEFQRERDGSKVEEHHRCWASTRVAVSSDVLMTVQYMLTDFYAFWTIDQPTCGCTVTPIGIATRAPSLPFALACRVFDIPGESSWNISLKSVSTLKEIVYSKRICRASH